MSASEASTYESVRAQIPFLSEWTEDRLGELQMTLRNYQLWVKELDDLRDLRRLIKNKDAFIDRAIEKFDLDPETTEQHMFNLAANLRRETISFVRVLAEQNYELGGPDF